LRRFNVERDLRRYRIVKLLQNASQTRGLERGLRVRVVGQQARSFSQRPARNITAKRSDSVLTDSVLLVADAV
jgi:hypothetical protein